MENIFFKWKQLFICNPVLTNKASKTEAMTILQGYSWDRLF